MLYKQIILYTSLNYSVLSGYNNTLNLNYYKVSRGWNEEEEVRYPGFRVAYIFHRVLESNYAKFDLDFGQRT